MNDIGASENPSNVIPLADSKFGEKPPSSKKKLWIGVAVAMCVIAASIGVGIAFADNKGGGDKPDPGPDYNDMLNSMLGSTPKGVGGAETLLWESMTPLT